MGKEKTPEEQVRKIKYLRSQGYSLPEISKAVNVSQTTAFRYIKGVKILPEHVSTWFGKRGGSKKRKLIKEKSAYEEGKLLVGDLSKKEKLLFLCALYWAEGSKGNFGLSNTDAFLIKVFMSGLREIFNIPDERFRISVRIYEDLDREKCLSYWSRVTGIPTQKFVNVNVLFGKKKGKLEYGMCRVRILKGGDILKKIVAVNKVISENMSL